MSTQMELDSGSITLEQITNQMLVHQNELRQLREEKAAMPQQLASLMSAPTPPPASTPTPMPASAPLLPARKALPFDHQWFFINEMLAMKVPRRVAPEYNNGPAVNYNPTHFLQYLGLIYNDSKAADRARNELEIIKQKPRERFDEYRMRFEDLLARSDSMDLPDREKIILIQSVKTKGVHNRVKAEDKMSKVGAGHRIANCNMSVPVRPGKTVGVRVCDVSEETEEETDSDDSEKDLPLGLRLGGRCDGLVYD
ncbi:hypothetical protein E4U58_007203 [Claviceps cyperi]|nr:hypothetical protein E4U58_007203 [Claviceps cyperi]